jgi:hypothetical protein
MQPSPPGKDDISFLSVAFKGIFKIIFIFFIVFIVSMVAAAAYLGSIAPKKYEGESGYERFDIVIMDSAEPPAKITVSHDYPIHTEVIGYYITDDVDLIEYQIAVCNTLGEPVFEKSSSLVMPDTISTYNGDTSYTVSEDLYMDLSPGTYHVLFKSTHPVKYSITQEFRYGQPYDVSIALAILAMILLVAVAIGALKKRDSLRNQRAFAVYSAQNYGAATAPGTMYGYSPAPAPLYGQPGYYQSPIEEPVDYMCAKCGNIIQNPVVQNVITCEKCGEKEYVG